MAWEKDVFIEMDSDRGEGGLWEKWCLGRRGVAERMWHKKKMNLRRKDGMEERIGWGEDRFSGKRWGQVKDGMGRKYVLGMDSGM